jgi:hypothetical protein
MTNQIFTPLSVIHANKSRVDSNFCTCTKIAFHGYEISISSDQSLCSNVDLTRTDIRVYQGETDITYRFIEDYNRVNKCQTNIFTDPDDLLFIMNTILSKKQSVVSKASGVIDGAVKGHRLYIGRRSGTFYEGASAWIVLNRHNCL